MAEAAKFEPTKKWFYQIYWRVVVWQMVAVEKVYVKCAKNIPMLLSLTYINCNAETKAESDIIVTSSNAETIINALPEDKPIIFAPDKNLGRYLEKKRAEI